MTVSAAPSRPIRLGMVGGGEGAFIGAVHRMAARLDGQFVFVAGALSSMPDRARASGQALGLSEDRIYDDFEIMAAQRADSADGVKAQHPGKVGVLRSGNSSTRNGCCGQSQRPASRATIRRMTAPAATVTTTCQAASSRARSTSSMRCADREPASRGRCGRSGRGRWNCCGGGG